MAEEPTLFPPRSRREESPAPGSGFAALDTRTHRETYRRLAVAAFVYSTVYVIAYASGTTVASRSGYSPLQDPGSLLTTVVAILGGIVVGMLSLRGRLPARSFETMACLFQVVASLGIAAGNWGWQAGFDGMHPRQIAGTQLGGVHWVGVWITAFPAIVPLPPRRILVTSLASALTVPGVALVSVALLGLPRFAGTEPVAGTVTILLVMSIPILICVGIATALAHSIFAMTRRVSKARRLGSYRLVEKLGSGAMGDVWRAEHQLLARPAAIKVIRPEALGERSGQARGALLRRFELEAQATAALTSPHTVELFDFGITDEGAFYSVMELLEGCDLRTLVERTGPVPPGRAVRFLRQACTSLADAHRHGMIHRDVKPGNLFACRQGLEYDFVKVLDFGLVKAAGDGEDARTQLSVEGSTQGTPAFMAPEMATGETTIDGRADLYALGCVGYWLLTGRLVFEAETVMAMILQHVREEPEPVSTRTELDVPPALDRVLLDCLAKDPRDRPVDALELSGRLARVEAEVEPWSSERAERWWTTHRATLLPSRPESATAEAGATVPATETS